MNNQYSTKVYATRTKDHQLLSVSSSGGMFSTLANWILDNQGVVACAVYLYEKTEISFKIIKEKEEIANAMGSKYIQSHPNNIYRECLDWLKKNPNKKLLFVGMGCQADGFRKYIEMHQLRERTVIVDIICHGSPSPKLWKEYANSLEKRYKNKITYLTFKDKRNGWKRPTAYVTINDQEISISEYVRMFYSRCALRPSCHVCPYTSIKRKIDMTIGDFWGIHLVMPDFYSQQGQSLVLIHSNAGENIFEQVKDKLDYRISNIEECKQPNLLNPTPVSKKRDEFWQYYYRKGIEKLVYKYKISDLIFQLAHKIKKCGRKLLK